MSFNFFKELEHELREISCSEYEYNEHVKAINQYLKYGDTSYISMKLLGCLKSFFYENKENIIDYWERTLTLEQIVASISYFLRRLEFKKVNKRMTSYFYSKCRAGRKYIYITYDIDEYKLSKRNALEYLYWLIQGNSGKHYEMKGGK